MSGDGQNVKFAVDGMLGRLARWLRLSGFDAVYIISRRPSEILGLARQEGRFILTRSTYLKDHEPERVFLINSDRVKEQMREVIRHFHLQIEESAFFTRCSLCNQPLQKISKSEVADKVPIFVYQTQEEFYRCPACQRIYWSGSHRQRMLQFLRSLC